MARPQEIDPFDVSDWTSLQLEAEGEIHTGFNISLSAEQPAAPSDAVVGVFDLLDFLDVQESDPALSTQGGSNGSSGSAKQANRNAPEAEDDESLVAMRRIERIREKNRLAQQRHRQKKKGQQADIDAQLKQKTEQVSSAKAKLTALTDNNNTLLQRVNTASTAVQSSSKNIPASTTAPQVYTNSTTTQDVHSFKSQIAPLGATSELYQPLSHCPLPLHAKPHSVGVTYESILQTSKSAASCSAPLPPGLGAGASTAAAVGGCMHEEKGKQEDLANQQDDSDVTNGKRLRGANGAHSSTQMHDLLARIAALPDRPHAQGMSDTLIDTMSMRCGVREKVPLRDGVAHAFKDCISRYRGLLSQHSIVKVLAAVAHPQEKILKSMVENMRMDAEPEPGNAFGGCSGQQHACENSEFLQRVAQHLMALLVLLRRETLTTAEQLSDEVDSMHGKLYTELQLSPDQRRAMAAHWKQWERRRRALSTLVDTAHTNLTQLPAHIDVPPAFFAHVSALSAPPCMHESPDSQMQDSESLKLESGEGMHMHDRCHMHASHARPSPDGSGSGGAQNLRFDSFDPPRFLGNHVEEILRANAALGALRSMHLQDRDMFVEHQDSHMPGVLVSPVQALTMWAHSMMSDVAPTDILALCQLAATQQHRHDLFRRT